MSKSMLDSIVDRSTADDVEERESASEELADLSEDIDSESDSLSTAVKTAMRFAQDDAETIQFNGTKAVSKLVKSDSVVRTLADQSADSDFEGTSLESIVNQITTTLSTDSPGKVRSRSALAVGRIASTRPAIVSTDAVFEGLGGILEIETKRIRIQRAIFALTYIGTYDAPRKDDARQLIRDHIDAVRDSLLAADAKIPQSIGLRACGVAALSYPDEILPADHLHQVVTTSSTRAKNRNRAIRSLWQLARTYPGVAVALQPTLSELLSYTLDDAQAADTLSRDTEADLRKYARYIRSNTAKTYATIATARPQSVDPAVIPQLVEKIEDRDGAIHRAILTIGELADEYPDELLAANAPAVLNAYLDAESNTTPKYKRHTKARGYSVWALLRLAETTAVDLELAPPECTAFIMAVPSTEKTNFDHRRTEALSLLAKTAPLSITDDSICEYLSTRLESSPKSVERRHAANALVRGAVQSSTGESILAPDSMLQLLEAESDLAVCTLELALLETLDTDLTTEIQSLIDRKEAPMRLIWSNLSDLAFETRLLCPNCGFTYSYDAATEGDLCERCDEGYLSGSGAPIDF